MDTVFSVFTPNRVVTRNTTRFIILFQIVLFFVIWTTAHFVLLPTPGEIAHSFTVLWTQEGLGTELLNSFLTNLEAIGLSILLSLGLAYATVLPFMRPIVSMFSRLRFLSMVGLTFIFTIMTASGHQLKLALLVFSMSVFFTTGMVDVINYIPKEKYDLARTLRFGEWQVVWEVIVLGRIDVAFDVLRQNAAIGWMMLTMVEGMVRSEGGIGALLLNQNKHFHLSAVFAIQITILAVGLAQDYLIGFMKKIVCPYADLILERR